MVFGFDDALSIGATLIGGLGGGKDTDVASAPQGGFETLPQPVKDAYLNTYLPDVLKQYNKPRTPIPMIRAEQPQSVFDPQELFRLQQFSDMVDGYFSPKDATLKDVYSGNAAVPGQPAAPAGPGQNEMLARDWINQRASEMAQFAPQDAERLRREYLGNSAMLSNFGAALASNPSQFDGTKLQNFGNIMRTLGV